MPRRSLLTLAERSTLLQFPSTEEELNRYYVFSEEDLSLISQRRGGIIGRVLRLCCAISAIRALLFLLMQNHQNNYWLLLPSNWSLTLLCGRSMPNELKPGENI